MSFVALLLALILEQLRPSAWQTHARNALRRWLDLVMLKTDTGQDGDARLSWGITVLLPTALAALAHWGFVYWLGWWAALALQVLLLYTLIGFRQFSHNFSDIRQLLQTDELEQARLRLEQWSSQPCSERSRNSLYQSLVSTALVATHRHVYGVFFWFTLLSALGMGAAGAVFYRLALLRATHHMARPSSTLPSAAPDKHTQPVTPSSPALVQLSERAWQWLDHAPARLTALGFAVVGRFEDTIDAWRRLTQARPEVRSEDLIVAAASGALGLRLTDQEAAPGDESWPTPDDKHLPQVIGLVWRMLLMYLLLLALLTLANLLG
jgi:adenosylcobinamide-phosphate synthase